MSNHLTHWIDRCSIYKTLKDRHHWSYHALSRATRALGWAATCHHAPPSHHNLRNQCSKRLLGQKPPLTERSSPDLPFYGGKTSIELVTCLHAPEKVSATMLMRSPPPHLLKPRSKAFRAPIQDTGTIFRLLGGRFIVCCWNHHHRIIHAPAILRPLLPRAQHVSMLLGTC